MKEKNIFYDIYIIYIYFMNPTMDKDGEAVA